MENLFSKAEELADNIKEYVNARISSFKLEAAEKGSKIVANAAARIAVAVMLLFFVTMASVAISLIVGEWVGHTWAGFLIVAGIFLLVSIIVWRARERLIRLPLMNSIIRQLFKEDEEDK